MLVIISDLHLGDGTAADSITASAFYLFAKRLRQDAHFASMSNGKYKPIKNLDVILMGDILDPLHSTGWLYPFKGENPYTITEPGGEHYIRPWSDWKDPRFANRFAKKLKEITEAVLKKNEEGLQVFKALAAGKTINFDAIDNGKRSTTDLNKNPLPVRFYYMVGNHDWYYHLKGEAFDEIRKMIVEKMGLCNSPYLPFPYDLSETRPESHSNYTDWRSDIQEGNNDAGIINELLKEYKVFARHGDYYDMFNFDIERGRDYSTLGDAFTMEVCNRFPKEVERMPGINAKFADELRQITNVRPALATPLWVTGQLKRISQEKALREPGTNPKVIESDLKEKWDQLGDNFLNLDFVRKADKWGIDMVDKMQLVIKLSKTISSKQMDDLVYMMQNRNATGTDHSFARFALKEPAFLQTEHPARYIVYGHTHHQETVPLDYNETEGAQVYFNSGTWHTYFDLARKNLKDKKFVPYKALTYVTFFKSSENDNPDVEHGEQNFETWSGAYA